MMSPRTHTYGIPVKHRGKQYDMGAACLPTEDGKGFEMRVVVRSPVPKTELPMVIEGVWERWLLEVRSDYSSLAVDQTGIRTYGPNRLL